MKYLLTILLLLPFSLKNHARLKVTWRPDRYHEPKVFYPDSLEYLKNERVNIWVAGKAYNVDQNCIWKSTLTNTYEGIIQ